MKAKSTKTRESTSAAFKKFFKISFLIEKRTTTNELDYNFCKTKYNSFI